MNCNRFRSEYCVNAEGPLACIYQRTIGTNCAKTLKEMYNTNTVCSDAIDKCAAEQTCLKRAILKHTNNK